MKGQVFNAGTNKGYSVKELLSLIYKLCDNSDDFKEILKKMKNKKTKGEIDLQIMDYEKLKKYVGWSPQYDITQGLIETIDWYREYLKVVSKEL